MRPCRGILLGLGLLAAGVRADPPPKVFSYPDRIRYDGQCLTINGRDTFIFSGSFPYFRCPPSLWRERFRRLKEAGCNAVETDVPWNWHERRMPASPDDYSQVDLREFQDWLRMAQDEFGFYTIICPGPYLGAEWDGGGFPRWLLTKVPVGGLRTDEPAFLVWSRHWLKAVCRAIAPAQVTRRPPGHGGVVLMQIESEFDLDRQVPESRRVPYLRVLYEAALAGGIDVPLFTCQTRQARGSSDPELAQLFDAVDTYPRFDVDLTQQRVREVEAAQPDAPAMVIERQAGGHLSEEDPGFTPAQLTADTLVAIQEGATLLNDGMIFGGTNSGRRGARDQATSADSAPVRELSGEGERFPAVVGLGRFLQARGQALARAHAIPCEAESGSPEVEIAARRDRAAGTYLFFRNRSVDAAKRSSAVIWLEHQGETRIEYELEPFGFKVLYLPPHDKIPLHGTWYPETGASSSLPPMAPAAKIAPSAAPAKGR